MWLEAALAGRFSSVCDLEEHLLSHRAVGDCGYSRVTVLAVDDLNADDLHVGRMRNLFLNDGQHCCFGAKIRFR